MAFETGDTVTTRTQSLTSGHIFVYFVYHAIH